MTGVPLRRIIPSIALLSLALGAIAAAPVRAAADKFDGAWSVVIITDQGDCDRAYRYGLRIEGGRVTYAGSSNVAVAGQVDVSGRVSVEVRNGGSVARGSGRLTGASGQGQWQGSSQNTRCSGRWQAERSG